MTTTNVTNNDNDDNDDMTTLSTVATTTTNNTTRNEYTPSVNHSSSSSLPTSNTTQRSTSSSHHHHQKQPLHPPTIHPLLLERTTLTSSPTKQHPQQPSTYILYLPTVLLRHDQNPAFAFACHLANYHRIPLLTYVTTPTTSTYHLTARYLSFYLSSLQHCVPLWNHHGSGVVIRPPSAHDNDVLTLASRATAVVADEPYVKPYLAMVERVERACRNIRGGVPMWRVDGSVTVAPCAYSKSQMPDRAWKWRKLTEGKRRRCVEGAMRGVFDAPVLKKRVERDRFWELLPDDEGEKDDVEIYRYCPTAWRRQSSSSSSPEDSRQFPLLSCRDLLTLDNIPSYILTLSSTSVDHTVPPCVQTKGGTTEGMTRWHDWLNSRKGLQRYARDRNDARKPFSVSRMSCFLNVGCVSIFRLINDIFNSSSSKGSVEKFEEEIIKWREFSYAHCYFRPGDYDNVACLPRWAVACLDNEGSDDGGGSNNMPSMEQLHNGSTGDATWDAMQRYLVTTGELHNNVRMTWGKQVVEWGRRCAAAGSGGGTGAKEILSTLITLNDRYALDGISPPSYAGILWCLGWGDTPSKGTGGGGIKRKLARWYKMGPEDFDRAQKLLLGGGSSSGGMGKSVLDMMRKRVRCDDDDDDGPKCEDKKKMKISSNNKGGTITSYFKVK